MLLFNGLAMNVMQYFLSGRCPWIIGLALFPLISFSQNLYDLVERCNSHTGNVKSIITKQKADFSDYQSPMIKRIDEYDEAQRIVRSEIYSDRRIAKTIEYYYIDSLLIYEKHQQPNEEDYLLVYQYLKKQYPRKILKVTPERKIINYARLEYSEDFVPVYMSIYNLLGDLLEKRTLEYYGKNHMVIQYFYPELEFTQYQKFERLCKFNSPDQLKKRDFKDLVTRPINIQKEDNVVRIIKAVDKRKKERIEIEELAYDESGNWLTKKTFELKKKKTKRRLIGEIEREITYY
jgi:hypothetical protein